MTEQDTQRHRAEVHRIEKGWSVYDSLGRPVGNVADVETRLLRVDGRPESLGFYEVSLERIRSADDGDVHLNVAMEELSGQSGVAAPAASALGGSGLVQPSPPQSGETGGSAFTSSATPPGLGSNTPVGDEPSSFQSWDESQEQRSVWSKVSGWVLPVGVLAAALAVLGWWRRRQVRRTGLARARQAVEAAALTPVWDAVMREPKRALWLTPLATLPVGLYVWSSRQRTAAQKAADRSIAAARLLPSAAWKDRLPYADTSWKDQLQLLGDQIRVSPLAQQVPSLRPRWWAVAVPAAAGATWFASRLGRGSRSGRRRLGDIMTPAPR